MTPFARVTSVQADAKRLRMARAWAEHHGDHGAQNALERFMDGAAWATILLTPPLGLWRAKEAGREARERGH